jgi:hypothetical protein
MDSGWGRTEVGDGLEQLGRQREADSGNVRDADEPAKSVSVDDEGVWSEGSRVSLLQDADKGFEFTAVVGRLLAHGSTGAGRGCSGRLLGSRGGET